MSKLTQKQEKFVLKYFECGNATEAYRYAYPRSKSWKDKSVAEKASYELNNNVKIMSRLQELRDKEEQKSQTTRDDILKRLEQMIFSQQSLGIDKIDLAAMNKSIDLYNKMRGYNEPEKHDVTQRNILEFEDLYSDEA